MEEAKKEAQPVQQVLEQVSKENNITQSELINQIANEMIAKPEIAPQEEKPKENIEAKEQKEITKTDIKEVNDKRISKAFAELARKEKQVRERELKIEENNKYIKDKIQLLELLESSKSNPENFFNVLEKLGLDYSEIASKYLNNNSQGQAQSQPQTAIEKKLEMLEKKLQEKEQQEITKTYAAQAQKTIDDFKTIIQDEKYKDLLDFYNLLEADPVGDFVSVHDNFLRNQKKILTPEEIANMLLPEAQKRLNKLRGAQVTQPIEAPKQSRPAAIGKINNKTKIEQINTEDIQDRINHILRTDLNYKY